MKTFYNTLILAFLISFLLFIPKISAQYYSLHFDGVDDYVGNMNESIISGNMPFTIEAWVKFESDGGFPAIINRGISSAWVYNMYSKVSFGIYVFEPPPYLSEPLENEQWYHIAGVRASNGYLYLFINGTKTDSISVGSTALISGSTPLWFGTYFTPGGGFKGKMTRIRISKIDRYINNFIPSTIYQNDANTVGLWNFYEGTGSILHDVSSNAINGTIYGTPEWSSDFPVARHAWQKNLLITDNGSQNKVITFGQAETATDSLDTEIGEYALPPVPPPTVFDARFNLPTIPPIGSLIDYRNTNDTSIVWTMTFQPGIDGYPMNFDWSDGSFPQMGNYFLRDNFGLGLVNVNMRTNTSYTLTNPVITTLKIEAIGLVTESVNVFPGWNLFSVPIDAEDMTAINLFPGVTSFFFAFNSTVGYEIINTLETGKGYWAKFETNNTFQITGNLTDPPNEALTAGWNMIGPFYFDVPVTNITTTPSGIMVSPFYGYNPGYSIADTLKIGKGYWVRVNANGVIHLNDGTASKRGTVNQYTRETEPSWGKINITDSEGAGITLYAAEKEIESAYYELPPVPPSGVFDARYNSGKFVEDISSGKLIMFSTEAYPITIKAEGINLTISDVINGEMLNVELNDGEELIISNNKISAINVIGKLSDGLPVSYELYQNYPNPFNPNTTIKFAVSQESNVNLSIYNVLGELVSTLVNEEMKPGYYEYEFNAANIASGIYIYRIQADSFIETKKMVLMK